MNQCFLKAPVPFGTGAFACTLFFPREPAERIPFQDAFIVRGRCDGIERQKVLRVLIGEGAERFQLSIQHGGVKGGKRDLVVGEAGLGLTDEVDFPTGELTDEDFISSAEKLKVDDIFKNVPCVAAGVIHQQAAEGGVDEVVLGIRLQDIFPAHVEADSLVEEKAVRQVGNEVIIK